jgi:MoxR-like ATPase
VSTPVIPQSTTTESAARDDAGEWKEELMKRRYHGDGQPHYTPLPGAWRLQEPYVAPIGLSEAVNMAVQLRRPLLVEGEPGTGKTRLAYSVAYELGYPLRDIYIRSTSQAKDLLYTFDAVRRLYEIQEHSAASQWRFSRASPRRRARWSQPADSQRYVKLGKLGEAIELSLRDIPSVVLIDEIDKADIDFPNDLLLVLDRLQFEVDEVPGMRYDASANVSLQARRPFLPIVIITSNREKELPAAFLRRCLYYFIPFAKTADELRPILEQHFQKDVTPLFGAALIRFWDLRTLISWRKPPSTSELLDWLSILEHAAEQRELSIEQVSTEPLDRLPYLEALLKTQSDIEALASRLRMSS